MHIERPFDPADPLVINMTTCDHTAASCVAKFDNLSRFTGEPFIPLRPAAAVMSDDETAWAHACVDRFGHVPGAMPKVETAATGVQSIQGITVFDPSIFLGFSDMGLEGIAANNFGAADVSHCVDAALMGASHTVSVLEGVQTTGYLQVVGELGYSSVSQPWTGSLCRYSETEVTEDTPGAVMSTDGLGGVRWYKPTHELQPGDPLHVGGQITGQIIAHFADPALYAAYKAGEDALQAQIADMLPSIAQGERVFLSTDNFGNWYLVKAERRRDWEAWNGLQEGEDDRFLIPNFAMPIDGPDGVEFSSWSLTS